MRSEVGVPARTRFCRGTMASTTRPFYGLRGRDVLCVSARLGEPPKSEISTTGKSDGTTALLRFPLLFIPIDLKPQGVARNAIVPILFDLDRGRSHANAKTRYSHREPVSPSVRPFETSHSSRVSLS